MVHDDPHRCEGRKETLEKVESLTVSEVRDIRFSDRVHKECVKDWRSFLSIYGFDSREKGFGFIEWKKRVEENTNKKWVTIQIEGFNKAWDSKNLQLRDTFSKAICSKQVKFSNHLGLILLKNKKGEIPFSGFIKYKHSHGQVARLVQYCEGKKNGVFVEWHKFGLGQKSLEGIFKDGLSEGGWIKWHENGGIAEEINFKNGKRDGQWIEYSANGKKYHFKGNFNVNNEREGFWVEWYTGGKKLKREGEYKNGQPHGTHTSWYSNGEKKLVSNYLDGEKHGPWIDYHENGQKSWEGNFNKGLKEGAASKWDKNGLDVWEGNFKDDVKHGPWIDYYENGQKSWEGNFKDDVKHGPWIDYHENGQKSWEGNFNKGLEEGAASKWDKNGLKVWEGNLKDDVKHGPWIDYYKSGQKMLEGEYRDGQPHGTHTSWYSNGEKKLVSNYLDGEKHGPWIDYHENGQKSWEGIYHHGFSCGSEISWFENGQKQAEGNRNGGVKDGSWSFWSEDGKIKQIKQYKNGIEVSPLETDFFVEDRTEEFETEELWENIKKQNPHLYYREIHNSVDNLPKLRITCQMFDDDEVDESSEDEREDALEQTLIEDQENEEMFYDPHSGSVYHKHDENGNVTDGYSNSLDFL